MNPRAYYNEFDPHAAAWLRNLIAAGLIAPGEVDTRSIVDVRPDDIRGFTQHHWFAGIGVWSYALRLAGWPDDRPVWTASCPCQPFSQAGKGDGFADERHLWPALFHLIEQHRPGTILGEQVASDDGLDWLDLVHDDMEGAGYAFGAVDTSSAIHGAPHIRQRLRWVADSSGGEQWRLRKCRAGHGPGELQDRGYGATRLMAHATSERPPARARGPRVRHSPRQPERQSLSGLVGESASEGWQGGEDRRGPLHPQRTAAERASGDAGGLGNAECERTGRHTGASPQAQRGTRLRPERDNVGSSGPARRPGPTNGFWRDADWIFCRDGLWRPVEPGSSPLVDGAAFRLGSGCPQEGQSRASLLKGYGNAVDAQATAGFIRAVAEAIDMLLIGERVA